MSLATHAKPTNANGTPMRPLERGWTLEEIRRDELVQDRITELYARQEVLEGDFLESDRHLHLLFRIEVEIASLEMWSMEDLGNMCLDTLDERQAHRAEQEHEIHGSCSVEDHAKIMSHRDRLFGEPVTPMNDEA